MPLIGPNDYVIYDKKRLCRVLEVLPQFPSNHFMSGSGFGSQIPQILNNEVKPAGLTQEDWDGVRNDSNRFLLRDQSNEEVFEAHGHDLLYVNEMLVLALMAKKDGENDGRESKEG